MTKKSWIDKQMKENPVRTTIIMVAGFFVLILIVIASMNSGDNDYPPKGKTIPGGIEGPTPKPIETNEYLVTNIIDGDTIDVEFLYPQGEKPDDETLEDDRVRLICIDTPEQGEYYYEEAKQYLSDLISNKEVVLIKDVSETDRYGRLLRYVYLKDGTFVNEELVRNGYASVFEYAPDTKLCDRLSEAENKAMEEYLGIWGEIPEELMPEPDTTNTDTGDYVCSSDYYNCGDFSTCSEVMAVFNACSGDIHGLDRDDDGVPCESLCG